MLFSINPFLTTLLGHFLFQAFLQFFCVVRKLVAWLLVRIVAQREAWRMMPIINALGGLVLHILLLVWEVITSIRLKLIKILFKLCYSVHYNVLIALILLVSVIGKDVIRIIKVLCIWRTNNFTVPFRSASRRPFRYTIDFLWKYFKTLTKFSCLLISQQLSFFQSWTFKIFKLIKSHFVSLNLFLHNHL